MCLNIRKYLTHCDNFCPLMSQICGIFATLMSHCFTVKSKCENIAVWYIFFSPRSWVSQRGDRPHSHIDDEECSKHKEQTHPCFSEIKMSANVISVHEPSCRNPQDLEVELEHLPQHSTQQFVWLVIFCLRTLKVSLLNDKVIFSSLNKPSPFLIVFS